MADYCNRFDMLIFEDAQEHVKRKEKELNKLKEVAFKERIEIEQKGLCQGCGNKGKNRWIREFEIYSCYDCFIHDLQCEADVMVPIHRAEDLPDYVSCWEWDELWEKDE